MSNPTTTNTRTTAAAAATTIPVIEKTLTLKASRARVWRAISEPKELARWFPERAELEVRPGGEGWFGWHEHGRYAVQVVAVEPPTYLAWRWSDERDVPFADAKEQTLVEWWLAELPDGGTVLRLRESGFTRPSHRNGNDEGWDEELGELLALLA